MDNLKKQRALFAMTLLVSLLSFGCFLTCMFSTDMVHGKVSNKEIETDTYGRVNVGLIWGTKQYNYGYGLRKQYRFNVYREYSAPIKGVTAAVLGFLLVACVFNVVGIVFSLENAFIIPVQTLQGPIGLFIWYGIASVCSLISFVMYSVLYPTNLKNTIQSESEEVFTDDNTWFGYGYYVLIAGSVLMFGNIGMVYIAAHIIDHDFLKNFKIKKQVIYNNPDDALY